MYDIKQLEADWRRYRRKEILKPLFWVSAVGVLALLVYLFWFRSQADGPVSSPSSQHERVTKTPSAVLPKSGEKSLAPEVPSVAEKKPKKSGWHMTFSDEKAPEEHAANPSKVKHVKIEVTSKKTAVTAQEIEARFRFAKDKDDALFLARYYYDKKQYNKALHWALETNKLDSDIEESWLLFGRAKAKLGLRMEAIRVLQAYYDRTGSPQAKKLLDHIRRGEAF